MSKIPPSVDIEQLITSEWFKSRPRAVQVRIKNYPPGLYRLSPTRHIVFIVSYTEGELGVCNECVVAVTRDWNQHLGFSRKVFGVKFQDLTPTTPALDVPCDDCKTAICHKCRSRPWSDGSMYCESCMLSRYEFLGRDARKEPLFDPNEPAAA